MTQDGFRMSQNEGKRRGVRGKGGFFLVGLTFPVLGHKKVLVLMINLVHYK